MNLTVVHPNNVTYCDLKNFGLAFHSYYIYLGLIVCIFGSIANILNIFVLTSRQMRCTTNLILTGLAVADLLVMIECIPFVLLSNVDRRRASAFSYSFAIYVMFHALFTQAFHFISCCLTVILAVWRYVAIKFPQNIVRWCGDNTTKITIILTYVVCPFVCTPMYLSQYVFKDTVGVVNASYDVMAKNDSASANATIYLLKFKEGVFTLISFYVYGVVIKLVPCVLLTLLSVAIIVELVKAKERRRMLMAVPGDDDWRRNGGGKRKASSRCVENEKQADRTTRMLLVVLLLFLMVEFPQAIMVLLNHIIGEVFVMECYGPLGELLDVFTLINSAINFVLYCTMSKKFRTVFGEVFIPSIPWCKGPKENWTSLQTLKTYV